MVLSRKTQWYKPLVLSVTAAAYILWLWVFLWCADQWRAEPAQITAVSILGTVSVAVYALLWWRLLGHLFTPYHIFLAFFTVFGFGQCILWAFGIHTDAEIGRKLVFSTLSAEPLLILRGQLLFWICFVTFNCGAMLVWSGKARQKEEPLSVSQPEDPRWQYLYQTAFLLSVAVIPVSLYRAACKMLLSLEYGYSSLYYGVAAQVIKDPLSEILSTMLFPCLLGLLLGSRFRKGVRIAAYCVFFTFSVMTLLGGDRGEWINLWLFLLSAEHLYNRPIGGKRMAVLAVAAIAVFTVTNAVVSLRNAGLSWDAFVAALLSGDSNPIVSMLTEFGHSMGISLLLLADPVTFPYGNTYWMTIPTLFGTGLGNRLFGMEYVQLHTWFPQSLGISYGTDFSMIGEAVLNCGVYAAPLVLLLEGMVIGKVTQLPWLRRTGPLGLCLSISVMVFAVNLARSTVWLVANRVIWMLILFPLVYGLVKLLSERRQALWIS